MIIISYCTPGNYEKVMDTHLKPSLEKWGLKHYIETIDSQGNWFNNTAYKAQFILDCLNRFEDDVCFLDADAVIEQYPEMLYKVPNDVACSCHYLDWLLFWRGQEGGSNMHLLSGTLVFKYNKEGLELAKKFVKEVNINPKKWEQKTLQEIVERDNYKVYPLPASYCAIRKNNGKMPEYVGKPVILHHQASRKFKRLPRP